MSLKSIPIRKDMYFTDYLLRWLEIIQADVKRIHLQGIGEPFTIHCSHILANTMQRWRTFGGRTDAVLQVLQDADIPGKPIKGNTIRHYHAVIHKALQDAVVVLRILQYNVADYVVAPKVDKFVAPYADTQMSCGAGERPDAFSHPVRSCSPLFMGCAARHWDSQSCHRPEKENHNSMPHGH